MDKNLGRKIECHLCSTLLHQRKEHMHLGPVIHEVANPVVRTIWTMTHVMRSINKKGVVNSSSIVKALYLQYIRTWPLVMNPDERIGFSGAWF